MRDESRRIERTVFAHCHRCCRWFLGGDTGGVCFYDEARVCASMSHNTFGHLFRVTTFGESHGAALGCVVDGCPPLIPLDALDIQADLDRRRPGQSRFTTQRREPDAVEILSGVFSDDRTGGQVTTGAPIALLIRNMDQRSKDYAEIRDTYRPGHADYTYDVKYGVRDYRGGGRSSARETAARVAAGAIARKILPGVKVRGALVQMGPHDIDRANWDWEEVDTTRSSARTPRLRRSLRTISTASARAAPRSAPSSRSQPRACRRASARRSMASSTRYCGGADVDQRRQGRRDRQRLRGGRDHRRGQR